MRKTIVITIKDGILQGIDSDFEPDFDCIVLDMDTVNEDPITSFHESIKVHNMHILKIISEIAKSYDKEIRL